MGFDADLFVDVFNSRPERDLKKTFPVLDIILNSPKSQEFKAMAKSRGDGGWAKLIKTSILQNANMSSLISDGYQTATSFPSSYLDPSSVSYSKPTDTQVDVSVNRICCTTTQLAKLDMANHTLGSNEWMNAVMEDQEYSVLSQISDAVCLELLTSGQCESATGGAATAFALDTSSDANFTTDWAQLNAGAHKQYWSRTEPWYLALNPDMEGIISMKRGITSSADYVSRQYIDPVEGKALRYGGFNLIYDHSITSGTGFAFLPSKFVGFLPEDRVQLEVNDDHQTPLSKFLFSYAVFGMGTIGKTVLASDGNVVSNQVQKEGILRLTTA